MDKDEIVLTEEEKAAEEEALKESEVKEEELRDKLAEEYGIDPEEESELLEKLVSREKSYREKFSKAIKQKISWRERAERTPKNSPKEGGKEPKKEDLNIEELLEQKLNAAFEQRELKSLSLPEEIEEEVKALAKVKGISVRDAASDPYIKYKQEQLAKEERIKNSTPKRTGRSSYAPSYDPSKPLNPADFDFSSTEGVKAWKEAKEARKKWETANK